MMTIGNWNQKMYGMMAANKWDVGTNTDRRDAAADILQWQWYNVAFDSCVELSMNQKSIRITGVIIATADAHGIND